MYDMSDIEMHFEFKVNSFTFRNLRLMHEKNYIMSVSGMFAALTGSSRFLLITVGKYLNWKKWMKTVQWREKFFIAFYFLTERLTIFQSENTGKFNFRIKQAIKEIPRQWKMAIELGAAVRVSPLIRVSWITCLKL